MEQVALRLTRADAWTLLGGDPDAKKPVEVVVRAFESAVEVAASDDRAGPAGPPTLVPRGEGRRLSGKFFFARPAAAGGVPCLISLRGL